MQERLVVDDVVYEIDRGPEGTKYRVIVGAVPALTTLQRERLEFEDMLPTRSSHDGLSFTPRVVGG